MKAGSKLEPTERAVFSAGGTRIHQPLDLLPGHGTAQVGERPAGGKQDGFVLVDVVQKENTVAQPGKQPLHLRPRQATGGAFQPIHQPLLVPLGLEPTDEPRAGV